jgi:predicted double-glycine peptidase
MKYLKVFEEYNDNSHLIIVDVQKSFKKYFTDNYLKQLKEYAKEFEDVYQIWDNHVQGPNVDKDYLYDKNPDIPNINDIYDFPNEKLRIEKRYNYDVNADFYKKILDTETYQEIKQKESNNKLKRGDTFKTTEGTIIVYVGNNHKWYHVPVKLYRLFQKLKGQHVVIVGGSDNECLLDIEVAAKALGVDLVTNDNYVYSASHCPIQ